MALRAVASTTGGATPGDVFGPGSSTDNAIVRFDGTTGKLIQNSGVVIDDSNNITGATTLVINSGTLSTYKLAIAGQAIIEGLTATSPGWYAQITGDTTPRVRVGLNVSDTASIAFGSGSATRDLFLERSAAATLKMGGTDSATPVAQNFGVQNVIAGTTDTAGANWTLMGSKGTGTGAGGNILFQTAAAAASTGSTQNALATTFSIAPGSVTVPSASFGLTGNISAAAWTTAGIRYKNVSATLTDTTSSGTVAAARTDNFGGNTIAASSATTYTHYTSAYFNDPTAGSNVTFTNKWSIGADSARFGTSNQLTISTAGVLTATSPVFTTPTLGVAAATSLALGGATIGANALAVTGSILFNTALIATNGGTGFASYAVGDLLSADTTTTLSKVAAVASGSVLASAGTGTLPAYTATPSVTTLTAGTLRTINSLTSVNFSSPGSGGNGISATNSATNLQFAGSTNVQNRAQFNGNTSTVLTANVSYANVIFGASPATEATSGTHPLLTNVAILAPVLTNDATAVTTDATSLYIAGAPTGITPTNTATAMWVAAGNSRFDGTVVVGLGSVGTPAIKTNTETTGFYFGSADDTIRTSHNGVAGWSFHSTNTNTPSTLTFTTAASGPILKQGANGRVGTFVANGVTPVTVNNTSVAVTDAIIISLNTVGGTVGALPAIQTITASTGFTVAGTALDTSTYNYAIIKNAA